jgi:hypothetical protein
MELISYTDAVGVNHLIALTTTNAYHYNSATQAWDRITPNHSTGPIIWDEFAGGADNRWSHTVAYDPAVFTNNGGAALVISNDVDVIFYFEGQSNDYFQELNISDFTSLASAKEVEEFWNHFFILNYNNGSDHVRNVAFTALGDIVNWTTGTSGAAVLTDTRGKLLRAKKLGSDMILYSELSITTCRYIGGVLLFMFPTMVYETGLFAEKAIWDFVNVHYFLGTDRKIYAYYGNQQLRAIGEPIEDSLFNEMSVVYKKRAIAGLDPVTHKLYFFFPTDEDTYAKKAYVYNYKQNPPTWEYHEFNDTVRDFSTFSNVSGWYADGPELAGRYADEMVFFADESETINGYPSAVFISHDGYIFTLSNSVGTFNGTDIPCTYETMDITADLEEHRFRTAWVSFNMMSSVPNALVDLDYSIDGGANWVNIVTDGSISSGEANVWSQHRYPIDIDDRRIRFRATQDSDKDFQLRAMAMKLEINEDR